MKKQGLSEDEVGGGAEPEEARELVGGGQDAVEEEREALVGGGVGETELLLEVTVEELELKVTSVAPEADDLLCEFEKEVAVGDVADNAEEIAPGVGGLELGR